MKILLALAVLLAAPATAAAADLTTDVGRLDDALVRLSKAKQNVSDMKAREQRLATIALNGCKAGTRAWKRIYKVRIRSQRNAYLRGARKLWSDLHEAALEGAAVRAYDWVFFGFFEALDPPLADPVLQGGVDAIRSRLAYYREVSTTAHCRTFRRLVKPVRQFKPGVSADVFAGSIYQRMARYMEQRRAAAARKHWPASREQALAAAAARFVELGGDHGHSVFFRYGAYSLKG
jgi:hypothetical protein